MTPVPSSLLRQRITIRPYEGDAADGATYGDPRTVKARVEGRRRIVRSPGGSDRDSTATATVRPGDEAPEQSQVEHDGRTYEVAEVITIQGLTRPDGYQLVLV